jgi:AcrR family transcriptional regulator
MSTTETDFNVELRQLILQEGVSGLTVGEIAARLRCSRRRIYEFAPSKEDLFLKVADEMFRSVRQSGWAAAKRHETASAKFAAYLRAGIPMVRETTDAFYADMDALPAGRRLFDSHQRERIAGLEHLIAEGIRNGEFARFHARVVAEIILSGARRIREPNFSAQTGATFEEAFSELSRLVRDGLRKRPSRTRSKR